MATAPASRASVSSATSAKSATCRRAPRTATGVARALLDVARATTGSWGSTALKNAALRLPALSPPPHPARSAATATATFCRGSAAACAITGGPASCASRTFARRTAPVMAAVTAARAPAIRASTAAAASYAAARVSPNARCTACATRSSGPAAATTVTPAPTAPLPRARAAAHRTATASAAGANASPAGSVSRARRGPTGGR